MGNRPDPPEESRIHERLLPVAVDVGAVLVDELVDALALRAIQIQRLRSMAESLEFPEQKKAERILTLAFLPEASTPFS